MCYDNTVINWKEIVKGKLKKMEKNYRLGIDLGTNSLGWALWELTEDGQPVRVKDAGVRLFSDGREPGMGDNPGESLAVARRIARGMRRRRDRLLQRKQVLINALVREGLWPQNAGEREGFSLMDPYVLRKKAIHEKLTKEELGRVLLHLCQRRGFKSNRKDTSKDDEKGKNKVRIKAFNEELDRQNAATLGEYLHAHKRQGIRFREESEYYPDRAHYEEEFDTIQGCQEKYFSSLDWDRLRNIIFHQRPLKPQIKGKCPYYTDQDRAHKALPSTHRFRILQELANLTIISPRGETISLSYEERDCLYNKLEETKELSFNSIRKQLNKNAAGNELDNTWRFNLEGQGSKEGEGRNKLNGNSTS
ncbi:MAG: hypothetical protein B0D92_02205, partial [Spirochaeta sp. LUC14_002_19_P3]